MVAGGNLGNLVVRIQADATKLKQEMKGGQKSVKKFAGFSTKQLKMVGLAFVAIGAAAAAAIAKIVKSSVEYGVALDNIAKQTGIAASEVAELFFVVEQEHGSITALTKSLPVLARNMSEASRGVETYKREFDALGVSVVDAGGELRDLKSVFFDIAKGVGAATNKTRALAAAVSIMGRGGKELFNVLKLGEEGIKKLQEEFKSFGVSAEDLNQFAADAKIFDDVWTSIKGKMQLAGIVITAQLLPVLEDMSRKILEVDWVKFGQTIGDIAASFLKLAEAAGTAIDKVASVGEKLGKFFGPGAEDILTPEARARLEGMGVDVSLEPVNVGGVLPGGEGVAPGAGPADKDKKPAESTFFGQVKKQIEDFNKSFFDMTKSVTAVWTKTVTAITNGFAKGISAMILEGKSFEDAFKDFVKNILTAFIDAVTQMIAKWLLLMVLTGGTGGGAKAAGGGLGGLLGGLFGKDGIAIPARRGLLTAQGGAALTGGFGEGGIPALLHPNEIVAPLDKFFESLETAKDSGGINITINGNVDDPQEMAEMVATEIERRRRGA